MVAQTLTIVSVMYVFLMFRRVMMTEHYAHIHIVRMEEVLRITPIQKLRKGLASDITLGSREG